MEIKYLGHSAFEIETGGKKILIDPFLVCVPDYKPENIYDIFVTHAHGDHLGSAIEISQNSGAPITAVYELANYCAKKGAKTNDIGLGSWCEYRTRMFKPENCHKIHYGSSPTIKHQYKQQVRK